MLNVNANLFRIAAMCQSSEKTRYYLCGVFVEPRHGGGVTMTATDGRYLVSIYDETGTCEKPVIVQLPRHTLQSCKTGKGEYEPRRLVMSDLGNAFVRASGKDVGVASQCIVDGAFPDWRRVVESVMVPPTGEEKCPAFDHDVLGKLDDVAKELSDGTYHGIMISGALTGSAALVRFTDASHAFGLIMPITHDIKPELPWWFNCISSLPKAA